MIKPFLTAATAKEFYAALPCGVFPRTPRKGGFFKWRFFMAGVVFLMFLWYNEFNKVEFIN